LLVAGVATPSFAAEVQDGARPAADDTAAVRALAESARIAPGEARRRLAAQPGQLGQAIRLGRELRDRGAGTWIDAASGRLVVNVTDDSAAETVRHAGAQPRRVARSGASLDAIKRDLDNHARTRGAGQAERWYVDVPHNQVVVAVRDGATDAKTAAFVARARRAGAAVRIETAAGSLRDAAEYLYGGQEIYNANGTLCSTAFNVRDAASRNYVLTAGHCARGTTSSYWYRNGGYLGRITAATTVVSDHAILTNETPSYWIPQPYVWRYDGYVSSVRGWSNTVVGSYVCKSGRTTGWTCGTVTAVDVTSTSTGGDTRYGQVQTNLCTKGGDSGGSVLVGNYAAGITSGSNSSSYGGRCGSELSPPKPNVMVFQPIGPVLSAYGVTLVTS
jgi:streptogrisin C